MFLYTYNPSYALYTVRDAETLEPITITSYLCEAEYICDLGYLPEQVTIIH